MTSFLEITKTPYPGQTGKVLWWPDGTRWKSFSSLIKEDDNVLHYRSRRSGRPTNLQKKLIGLSKVKTTPVKLDKAQIIAFLSGQDYWNSEFQDFSNEWLDAYSEFWLVELRDFQPFSVPVAAKAVGIEPVQIYLKVISEESANRAIELGINPSLDTVLLQNGSASTDIILEPLSDEVSRTPLNLILYGPVGTGKTKEAIELANEIVGPKHPDNVEIVTFHKSYAYENFVEGIVARTKEGNLEYIPEGKIFKTLSEKARAHMSERFVLIIDELNRGDVSRIFGELITLLEKERRLGNPESTKVKLQYSAEEFGVPNNLYIIGTMNSTDRSISLLDHALRRRFSFRLIPPDANIIRSQEDVTEEMKEILVSFFERLNAQLSQDFGPDMQLGHAFFLKIYNFVDLKEAWDENIAPTLDDWYYGNSDGKANLLSTVFTGKSFGKVDSLMNCIQTPDDMERALSEGSKSAD